MSQIIPIYIPTYIGDQNYSPNRVLPRLLFYNGMLECEEYYIESGSLTNSGIPVLQDRFPYFDNYNVVTGSFPTTDSDSLLFNNEAAAYGEIPTGSLYTNYWETYVNLLYNPRTRLFNCEAIIPLADYYKMELNDIVEWRGNYYHLRAINEYNLKNGECKIQLLGPLEPPVISNLLPEKDCGFNFTSSLVPTLLIDYLVVAGGGGGGLSGGGGGAGGLISGSLSLFPADEFNITIGLGGAGGTSSTIDGANGNTSSIYNVDTFVSYSALGGGGGGSINRAGITGGSGGGAGYDNITTASGTLGQGNAGGISPNSSVTAGGGGASQVGQDGEPGMPFLPLNSGAGGSGSAWLNGIYYAGGGGGGAINQPFYVSAAGGVGGGGIGAYATGLTGRVGGTGSVNTGGGGGGGANGASDGNGGNGGSGIVIIRYAGSGSQATGGTISYSGSYTYHTFTTSGLFEYV